MTERAGRLLMAIAVFALVVGAAVAGGCGRNPRQTTVVPPERVSQKGLTPLERGRVRGDVLAAARPATEAWRSGDVNAMKRYFSAELVSYNSKLKVTYARQGRVRVRRHRDVSIDVVELTPSGDEASVRYDFKNYSYFASSKTGRALTKPTGKGAEIDMILKRAAKGWIVTRMFSGRDELM